jgi:hypothetical protein
MEYASGTPFFVRDSTGVCTVHPDGAEVTPTDKSQWYCGPALVGAVWLKSNDPPAFKSPGMIPPQ